jgi:cell division protein FtsI/penicillin-binding protein 2
MTERWSSYEILSGKRGNILFRDGSLLAGNQKVARVVVDPHLVSDAGELASILAPRLGKEPLEIARLIREHTGNGVVVAEAVGTDTALEIDKLGLAGVVTRYHYQRFYPFSDFGAAPTIGYISRDGGLTTGLESYFDAELRGRNGRADFLKDASRHRLPGSVRETSTPVNGRDVTTTLDPEIQLICEKELRAAIDQHNPEWGCIIVMEPASGELLGVSTYPNFDPNKYVAGEIGTERNVLVHSIVEPGGTVKPILAAYALDQGWLNPNKRYKCYRPYPIGKYTICEAEPTHYIPDREGAVIREIICHSSNVGMAQIALELGEQRIMQAYSAMGFFAQTGIELPLENSGLAPFHYEQQHHEKQLKWPRITVANTGFGQGLAVTPLQLAGAYCTLVNGGYRVVPTLVVRDARAPEAESDGLPELPSNEAILAGHTPGGMPAGIAQIADLEHGRLRVISAETSELVKEWLAEVVSSGTGKNAAFDLHTVGGKTGTGQIPASDGGYRRGAYTAAFAGFWPVEEPEYVTLVLLVHPRGNAYYGGAVAAPVFRRVAEQISRCDRSGYAGEGNAAR